MARQDGVAIFRTVIVLGILALVGFVALRAIPVYQEYFAVRRDLGKIVSEGTAQSPTDVRRAFDQAALADNIKSLRGADLDVITRGGRIEVSYAYRAVAPLSSSLSLYFDFQGSESSR